MGTLEDDLQASVDARFKYSWAAIVCDDYGKLDLEKVKENGVLK